MLGPLASILRLPAPRRRGVLRAWPLAAGGVVALALAGCGTSSSSSSTHHSSGAGTLRITSWFTSGEQKDALDTIDAAFEKKYPDIKIDLVTAPDTSGPYATLLQTSVDSRSADIVSSVSSVKPLPRKVTRATETDYQYWATSGAFLALNGQSWLKRFQKAALAADTYNGKVYAIPNTDWQSGVFYNKAIFKKYGLTVPTTYSQFLSVCKTLAAHGVTPLYDGLGGVGGSYLSFVYQSLMGELWQPTVPGDNLGHALTYGETKWTAPQFTKVLDELHTIASYLEPGYAGVSYADMPGGLANGKAAMLLDGSWDVSSVVKDNPKIQLGFFPLPGSDDAARNEAINATSDSFAVVKGAPNTAAALKWFAFFSSPAIYRIWIEDSGGSTVETGSEKFGGVTAKVLGKWFGKGYNSATLQPAFSSTGAYYDQSKNWPDLLLDVADGSKTPAQVEKIYQSGWSS